MVQRDMAGPSLARPLPGARVGYLLEDQRARDLVARLQEARSLTEIGASRVVMFLTEHCNMKCQYCLSIKHAMPRWSVDEVKDLLSKHADMGARHIQWTGGEASLFPSLPELVRYSTDLGLVNSISTNGTASAERFRDLVGAGMSRFYISLDTLEADSFDSLTGSRGLLSKVLSTIELLTACRDGGDEVHITLNTLLRGSQLSSWLENDGKALESHLSWLRESGVDDFKFLPDSNERFSKIFGDSEDLRSFVALCRESVPESFGMFHHRLGTIARGGHGFPDDRVRHCYHCLDDRAYDSVGAYACVIQIREGGEPIYRHDDSEAEKSQKLTCFVESNRGKDAICRSFCFDLYRDFNERVAWLLENVIDATPGSSCCPV